MKQKVLSHLTHTKTYSDCVACAVPKFMQTEFKWKTAPERHARQFKKSKESLCHSKENPQKQTCAKAWRFSERFQLSINLHQTWVPVRVDFAKWNENAHLKYYYHYIHCPKHTQNIIPATGFFRSHSWPIKQSCHSSCHCSSTKLQRVCRQASHSSV